MLVSYRWLQELCPVDADVSEVARRISLAGLEVEAMEEKGRGLRRRRHRGGAREERPPEARQAHPRSGVRR